jgi:translation initiation factor IF-1
MSKEETLKIDGKVIEVLPNGMFKVNIDGHIVLAYTAGNMRKNKIKIIMDDRVSVEMSPYDLSKGRITYRYK